MYKKEFDWLKEDKDCQKAVDHLVAHSGYSESESKLKLFIKESGVEDVERVFGKLVEKKILVLTYPNSLWGWTVRIVTIEGSPYRRRY